MLMEKSKGEQENQEGSASLYIGVRPELVCSIVNCRKINGQWEMSYTSGVWIGLSVSKELCPAVPIESPVELGADEDAECGNVQPDQGGDSRTKRAVKH